MSENKKSKKNKYRKSKKNKVKASNQLNNFKGKNNFLSTITKSPSIFSYRIGIYWIPLVIYLGLFHFIQYSLVTITSSETLIRTFGLALLSFILMYIIYFVVDLGYQFGLCRDKSVIKLLFNSLNNAFIPALFVLFGFIAGMFIIDDGEKLKAVLSEDNAPNDAISTINLIQNRVNLYHEEMILSTIFYIFSLLHRNPINRPKCNLNKIC